VLLLLLLLLLMLLLLLARSPLRLPGSADSTPKKDAEKFVNLCKPGNCMKLQEHIIKYIIK
jgi:hypothetical protein